MKIEEAIKVLEDQAGKGYHFPDQKRKEASRLGAEALKAWQEDREGLEPGEYELLPGETTEAET